MHERAITVIANLKQDCQGTLNELCNVEPGRLVISNQEGNYRVLFAPALQSLYIEFYDVHDVANNCRRTIRVFIRERDAIVE